MDANEVTLKYQHNCGPITDRLSTCEQFLEIQMSGKKVRVSSNDDIVFTEHGFCCVVNVVKEGDQVWFVVRKYREVLSAFMYPYDSVKK